MMESNPSPFGIRRITVSRKIISGMLKNMREFGEHNWELLVLWVGHVSQDGKAAKVEQAFVPKQRAISSEDGVGYFVSSETLFKLNKDLADSGLRLIAQVHSHPREAYHSEADDRYAIVTAQGGLSLVVPDFGNAPSDPSRWAIYRLRNQEWIEVQDEEAISLFEVVDSNEH